MRWVVPRGVHAAAIVAALFLSGCFKSSEPLLSAADAVTPLPREIALGEVDKDGRVKLDSKGQASGGAFTLSGSVYGSDDGLALTFAQPFGSSGTYLLQATQTKGKVGDSSYALASLESGHLTLSVFQTSADTKSTLLRLGVAVEEKEGYFYFFRREQLIDAVREAVKAGRLSPYSRFRVMTSMAEVEAFTREVAALRQANQDAKAVASTPAPERVSGEAPPRTLPEPHRSALRRATDQAAEPLNGASLLFFGGVASHLLDTCRAPSSASDKVELALFVKSAMERATLGANYSNPDIGAMVRQNVAGTTIYAAGVKFAEALDCGRPAVEDLAQDILKAIRRATRGADGGVSPFVKTCSPRFSETQCACLAQVGLSVIPEIHQLSYHRDIIARIIKGSPLVALQIPMMCSINNY